jgi:predicted nucleic acid-binding protein
MTVFLYANVFLDAMLQNRKFKKAPIEILNLCSKGKIKGYTSGINLANITYFIQKATEENVTEVVSSILKYIEIVPLEKKDFIKALTYNFGDPEDAYQCVASEKAKAKYLITRNIKDFKKCSATIMTTEEFLENQQVIDN